MERALSQDERIRRAEEIYYRRQNIRERRREATVNVYEQKNYKVLKRVMIQTIICLLIYCIFYLINTTKYSFSEVTLNITGNIISKEVDFLGIYNDFIEKISGYIPSIPVQNEIEENKIEENKINEETMEVSTEVVSLENHIETENIDDIKDNAPIIEDKSEDVAQEEIVSKPLSETEKVKQKYSFILPAKRMDIIRIWRKNRSITSSVKISSRNRYSSKYRDICISVNRWKSYYSKIFIKLW